MFQHYLQTVIFHSLQPWQKQKAQKWASVEMHSGLCLFQQCCCLDVLKTKEGNGSFRCYKWMVKQSANFTVILFVDMHAISLTRVDSQHQVHFQKEGQPRVDRESCVVLGGMTGM